ncbi:MAG: hypothetical protein WDW38_008485 [Sanguina aurantia]
MAKFNAPNIQWVRVHDKKIRVKRKLAGLEAKHKAGVKRVSGVRTGKNIRKTAHKVRMNDKEKAVRQLLLKDTPHNNTDTAMVVKVASKSVGATRRSLQRKGKKQAAEAMQE